MMAGNQNHALSPLEQFTIYLTSEKGKEDLEKLFNKYGESNVRYTLHGLKNWLHRYRHSPRARKKNWYRFILNNIGEAPKNRATVTDDGKHRKAGEYDF